MLAVKRFPWFLGETLKFESWNYVRTVKAVGTLHRRIKCTLLWYGYKAFGTLSFKSDMYESQVTKIQACDDQFWNYWENTPDCIFDGIFRGG